MLVLSDKTHRIAALLTPKCYKKLTQDRSLPAMKSGLVSLSDYCLSTVAIAAGNQHFETLSKLRISFPLCLQCSGMQYLGGDDLLLMGEPADINRDETVLALCKTIGSYEQLVQIMSRCQFPAQGQLPEFGASFCSQSNNAFSLFSISCLNKFIVRYF